MHPFFRNLCLLFAAFLPACSPARTEVAGNALTTNVRPYISIAGASSLLVKAHGRLWADSATDLAASNVSVAFNYAIFADSDSGPVTRYAYAAIARLSQSASWRFEPQSNRSDGAFSFGQDGDWTVQLLRVPGQGDWSSDIWRKNGRETSEFWIAKRWNSSLNAGSRVVMEYREPWPGGFDLVSSDFATLRGEAAEVVQAFIARADAAFVVEKTKGDFSKPAPQQKLTVDQGALPDIPKLVGRILRTTDN